MSVLEGLPFVEASESNKATIKERGNEIFADNKIRKQYLKTSE